MGGGLSGGGVGQLEVSKPFVRTVWTSFESKNASDRPKHA